MLIPRLRTYPFLRSRHPESVHFGEDEPSVSDVTVYLDIRDPGTEQFITEVYPDLFTAQDTYTPVNVSVFPVAPERAGVLRSLSVDLRSGLRDWTLTGALVSEYALATARTESGECMMKFLQRVLKGGIVGEYPVSRAETYLDSLDADVDVIRELVQSGEVLASVIANSERWVNQVRRLRRQPGEDENRTVFIGGERLTKVDTEVVLRVSESMADLHE